MIRSGIAAAIAIAPLVWLCRADAQTAQLRASQGVYTVEQARHGRAIYAARCASCHGADLSGMDAAKPLNGAAFSDGWSGQNVDAFAKRIRTTMPPAEPGSLGLEQTTLVVAYILQANGFRPGAAPLSGRAVDQRAIVIDQAR